MASAANTHLVPSSSSDATGAVSSSSNTGAPNQSVHPTDAVAGISSSLASSSSTVTSGAKDATTTNVNNDSSSSSPLPTGANSATIVELLSKLSGPATLESVLSALGQQPTISAVGADSGVAAGNEPDVAHSIIEALAQTQVGKEFLLGVRSGSAPIPKPTQPQQHQQQGSSSRPPMSQQHGGETDADADAGVEGDVERMHVAHHLSIPHVAPPPPHARISSTPASPAVAGSSGSRARNPAADDSSGTNASSSSGTPTRRRTEQHSASTGYAEPSQQSTQGIDDDEDIAPWLNDSETVPATASGSTNSTAVARGNPQQQQGHNARSNMRPTPPPPPAPAPGDVEDNETSKSSAALTPGRRGVSHHRREADEDNARDHHHQHQQDTTAALAALGAFHARAEAQHSQSHSQRVLSGTAATVGRRRQAHDADQDGEGEVDDAVAEDSLRRLGQAQRNRQGPSLPDATNGRNTRVSLPSGMDVAKEAQRVATAATTSAQPPKRGGRKRKDGTEGPGPGRPRSDKNPQERREEHKEVERKRRRMMAQAIEALAEMVPGCEPSATGTSFTHDGGGGSGDEVGSASGLITTLNGKPARSGMGASKGGDASGATSGLNKGIVIQKAAQYIQDLKHNEASNIEKWTLEKLLMDQAMGDLGSQLDEVRRENAALRAVLANKGVQEEEILHEVAEIMERVDQREDAEHHHRQAHDADEDVTATYSHVAAGDDDDDAIGDDVDPFAPKSVPVPVDPHLEAEDVDQHQRKRAAQNAPVTPVSKRVRQA